MENAWKNFIDGGWKDYASFNKMISPVVIEIFFFLGLVLVVIGALVVMFEQDFGYGLLLLLFGPILLRFTCETWIVLFKIHEALEVIKNNTSNNKTL